MDAPSTRLNPGEIIGLVDCHCAYVSMLRVFEPKLIGRPVVVLSSNDSAVVSRSDEAKALGVKMAQPAFELRDLVARQGLILKSSNFALFDDMSRRVMQAIADCTDEVDVHSVDEAFIRLTGMRGDLEEIGRHIQASVLKKTGIPTGVGISRNKTTAKICNWASKKWKAKTGSVVALLDRDRMDKLLDYAHVSEVWGIGARNTEHLASMGITTAGQLCRAEPRLIRKHLGVTVERTVHELNWRQCFGFGEAAGPRKTMASTRSFGQRVKDLNSLEVAICCHSAKLCLKLRAQGSMASVVKVFIATSYFATIDKRLSRSACTVLLRPTNDTRVFTEAAILLLREIYISGFDWAKSGVIVTETVEETGFVSDIFAPPERPKSAQLMQALDKINRLAGPGTVRFGRESANRQLGIKQEFSSPRATTAWGELINVK
jgi:DNA polymerase V